MMNFRRPVLRLPSIPRDRLAIAVMSGLVVVLALGLIAGGVLLVTRRSSASATVRLSPDNIAPALALRSLAGEADTLVLDQALEENKLETAFATLALSTILTDQERATYYIALGQKFAEARQKERARFCYTQATSILLLSASSFDSAKAGAHLTLGKDLAVIGDRADAERNLDFAYTIARYSPFVDEPQRRFILSNLATEYKGLGLDQKSDESTRAQTSLPASYAAIASPAEAQLPSAPLGDDVKAATAWRMRAAQRLINSLGSKNNGQIEEARRNLEDALRAEDDLRSLVLENRLGQAPTTDIKAALAKSRADWLVLRSRVSQKGFGISLSPSWEKSLAQTNTNMRQAFASYFLLRREMAVNLTDPVDAAQARVDLLREEMEAGKLGLYPDYPENRLITELAQATKERIDLREDGLYIAVLSQQGSGQLVITTADLWGRPAAMASAGLGMSFPTMRPPTYAYVPTATPVPTHTATTAAGIATATARRATEQAPTTVTQQTPAVTPTQPTSGLATPTFPSSLATATPIIIPFPSVMPTLPPSTLPTPIQLPTSTPLPTATATPAYNYQVIYAAGPTVRQQTGNDNFHVVGMVVDQNGILMSGLQERLLWCCPAGQAVRPRPTIDVDNGRFDFFIGRGQFTLDVVDGDATTQPVSINTDVPGLTGYVEWEYTFQRTNKGVTALGTRTPTATPTASTTGTPRPATPTPPLPGATTTRIALDPGWNFVGLPLSPVDQFTATSLQNEISLQLNVQGGGVAQVSAWDGSGIRSYAGNIAMGTGYFLNVTGTQRMYWEMTGYPLVAPVSLNLNQSQKTSITLPYMAGGAKNAEQLRIAVDDVAGDGTFVRLYRMRDGSGTWEWYDGTATGIASFPLSPERGYLLEVSRTFTWAPWQPASPTPTPTATYTPTATPTASPTPFDTYEPNNTFDQAGLVSPENPVVSYVSYPSDRDFFKFSVATSGTLYISLTNLPVDYDLYLYNPARQEIDASFNGGQTPEYITKTITTPGLYFTLVQGAGPVYDPIKPYKLLISIGP